MKPRSVIQADNLKTLIDDFVRLTHFTREQIAVCSKIRILRISQMVNGKATITRESTDAIKEGLNILMNDYKRSREFDAELRNAIEDYLSALIEEILP